MDNDNAVTRAELNAVLARVSTLEQHEHSLAPRIVEELHQKVFAAVDARPPAPQLYKIDPDFLDRFDKLERETKGVTLDEVRGVVKTMIEPLLVDFDQQLSRVVTERVGRLQNLVAHRFEALERRVNERMPEAAASPAFEPVERATNQTPAPPQAIEEFREQLAARPLPELGGLEPYAPELPELAPLQDGEPITKKEPAETATGEPQENT